jgi:hypothetical protein
MKKTTIPSGKIAAKDVCRPAGGSVFKLPTNQYERAMYTNRPPAKHTQSAIRHSATLVMQCPSVSHCVLRALCGFSLCALGVTLPSQPVDLTFLTLFNLENSLPKPLLSRLFTLTKIFSSPTATREKHTQSTKKHIRPLRPLFLLLAQPCRVPQRNDHKTRIVPRFSRCTAKRKIFYRALNPERRIQRT